MTDNITSFLGLMRRANALCIGEKASVDMVRSGKAELLMVASNSGANAVKRAENSSAFYKVRLITLPYTKEELSDALGKPGCSMLATDNKGFADSLLKKLNIQ